MSDTHLIAPAVRYKEIKPGYRVGDDGSVWSRVGLGKAKAFREHWTQLRPHPMKSYGHLQVMLGRRDYRYVHRLVLEAFVGPCPDGLECLHDDGKSGNNRLDNLRWGTRKENYVDSVRHGTAHVGVMNGVGEDHPGSKLTEPVVRKIMAFRAIHGFGAVKICALLKMPRAMRGAVHGVICGQSWNHLTGLPLYQTKSHTVGRPKRAAVAVESPSDNGLERASA